MEGPRPWGPWTRRGQGPRAPRGARPAGGAALRAQGLWSPPAPAPTGRILRQRAPCPRPRIPKQRLRSILSRATIAFLGISLVLGLAICLLRSKVFGLFSPDPAVLEAGYRILRAMLVSVLESNIMAAPRGLSMIPLIVKGHRAFGLDGVIWALPAAEILSCAVGSVLWLLARRRIQALPLAARRELAAG